MFILTFLLVHHLQVTIQSHFSFKKKKKTFNWLIFCFVSPLWGAITLPGKRPEICHPRPRLFVDFRPRLFLLLPLMALLGSPSFYDSNGCGTCSFNRKRTPWLRGKNMYLHVTCICINIDQHMEFKIKNTFIVQINTFTQQSSNFNPTTSIYPKYPPHPHLLVVDHLNSQEVPYQSYASKKV